GGHVRSRFNGLSDTEQTLHAPRVGRDTRITPSGDKRDGGAPERTPARTWNMATGPAPLQDSPPLRSAELHEPPDLERAQPQVEELWGLDAKVAEALLNALVSAGFLTKTPDGAYVRGNA